MICITVEINIDKTVKEEDLRFLLTGGLASTNGPVENPTDWLSDKLWREICILSENNENFKELSKDIKNNQLEFKRIYEASDPVSMSFPEPYHSKY